MPPSQNLGLHHMALRIKDMKTIRRFYVELLGFGIERELPNEELWLTAGSDSLVFLRGEAPLPASKALDHFGIIVPKASDVAAWEAYLRRHEVPIIEPTETYEDDGSVGLICCDPAGHHVQVLWHPAVSQYFAIAPEAK